MERDMERLAEIHREQASLMRQLEQLKHEEMEIQARMAEQQGSQQAADVQSALQDQPAVALHVELQQTAPAISSFLDLPDELSILVWRAILAMDVCSAMRLCQANKSLCCMLEPVKAEAKAYWLRWGAQAARDSGRRQRSGGRVRGADSAWLRSPQRQSLACGAW